MKMDTMEYPIRAVSKLTGLSVDTLRAWERRYEAVKPARNGHGRLYSEADVARLTLLREAVSRGHAISQLVALSDEQLRSLSAPPLASSVQSQVSANPAAISLQPDLQTIISAVERFDFAGIDRALSRLATLAPARNLLNQALMPLMDQIGERWYQGTLTIAQEHMVSAAMRNLLGTLIRLYTRTETSTKLLFATPAGELHEFGILSSAVLAVGGGLGITYLGVDLPASEIVEAAKRSSAQVVVLGVKGAANPKQSVRELRRISELLPVEKELWVGGPDSEDLISEIGKTR
ncbi:MAG: MerR family transcriptional regulator, partial [Acidobacteriota bacterium]